MLWQTRSISIEHSWTVKLISVFPHQLKMSENIPVHFTQSFTGCVKYNNYQKKTQKCIALP